MVCSLFNNYDIGLFSAHNTDAQTIESHLPGPRSEYHFISLTLQCFIVYTRYFLVYLGFQAIDAVLIFEPTVEQAKWDNPLSRPFDLSQRVGA